MERCAECGHPVHIGRCFVITRSAQCRCKKRQKMPQEDEA